MTGKCVYHYVYRITNLVEKKHYYGKRSSKCDPKEDLGKKYFSSSTDKEFLLDQKNNPQNYRYKIVQRFGDGKSAILRESILHYKFNVGRNDHFYNKVKQKLNGYDRTGIEVSEDTREKLAKTQRGKKHSEERKKKRALAIADGSHRTTKGRKMSKEQKEQISVTKTGCKTGRTSNDFTDEWKLNLSLSLKGKIRPQLPPEIEKRRILAKTTGFNKIIVGRIWVNNGQTSKRIYPKDLNDHPGYILGRLKKSNHSASASPPSA